jgi:hypothetical protein
MPAGFACGGSIEEEEEEEGESTVNFGKYICY